MTKLKGEQLSLITELGTDDRIVGDWGWEKLGTKDSLVPNSPLPELGTKIWLVPNFDDWKPPIGCLQQKWIKDHQYWYWRYYDNRGKKASLYLCKDYNKAIRKAIKIGVPTDAKLPNMPATDPQIQTPNRATDDRRFIAPTAHSASSHRAAA
jgi:hypothetical protein